jgi:hypothetical protein
LVIKVRFSSNSQSSSSPAAFIPILLGIRPAIRRSHRFNFSINSNQKNMKKKPTMKQQAEMVNNLCVRTYMEILGYCGGIVEEEGLAIFKSPFKETGALYVDRQTNTFRLDHGKRKGGVLDLACALFKETRSTILRNIVLYRIDLLMSKCGSRSGAI